MSLQGDRIEQLRAKVGEIDAIHVSRRVEAGAHLIDIREPDEVSQGSPEDAIRVPRAFLELRIESIIPDPTTEIVVLCASGVRSLFAADALIEMGYSFVSSVRGGFAMWRSQNLPFEQPRILTAVERERYARHLLIPEVGEAGQLCILGARVALIGAGGLGSPIAYYLAAAGVGTLMLFDDDVVERSNLQRQILHSETRIGQSKLRSTVETINALNPAVSLECHEVRLDTDNAQALLASAHLIIDGSDNLATRYVLNDAALALGVPLIYGAIFRFEGQVSVFWPQGPSGGPCYRCLFPEPPPAELTPSCAEAGVMGVLPGVIGTLMANEALKLLVGMGEPLTGRLVTFNALSTQFEELVIDADPECRWCGRQEEAGSIVSEETDVIDKDPLVRYAGGSAGRQ